MVVDKAKAVSVEATKVVSAEDRAPVAARVDSVVVTKAVTVATKVEVAKVVSVVARAASVVAREEATVDATD